MVSFGHSLSRLISAVEGMLFLHKYAPPDKAHCAWRPAGIHFSLLGAEHLGPNSCPRGVSGLGGVVMSTNFLCYSAV